MIADRWWPPLPDIAPEPVRCPDCDAPLFPGASLCESCAAPLSVAATTTEGSTGDPRI